MQNVRHLVLLLATAFLLIGCAEESTTQEKLDLANQYLSEYGGSPNYRASALDLYRQVLPEAEAAGNDSQQVEAHFGIGMIGFLDLAQAIPQLVESMAADDAESEGEEAPELPPAEDVAEIVETLLHQVLGVGIVDHFAEVKDEETFSFYFENLIFPATDPDAEDLDLSGTWDLTEVRLLYGTFQLVLAGADYVFAYDDVIETILEGALSGAEIPPLPASVADFPLWLTAATEAMGFEELPWLRAEFGVLPQDADLAAIRARMDDGFASMADGLAYVQTLDRDEDELRTFPGTDFIGSVLDRLIELPAGIPPTVISALISPAALEGLFRDLHASVAEDAVAFVIPDFVWALVSDLGGILLVGYDGPLNPVDLGVPALNLSRLFTDPIEDLKDRDQGLLPYFDSEGIFEITSEYGENDPVDFSEVTHDGPMPTPCGDVDDAANGIDDPVYLFFCNADLNGLLVPVVEAVNDNTRDYRADHDVQYTNADFMRLVSHTIWIVDSVGEL